MKRSISKRILKGILVLLELVLGLIIIINIPIITLRGKSSDEDYSDWMSKNLQNDQLVVDVAMLGAHDAFSKGINIFSSLDPYESNGMLQGVTGLLIKGFIVKQSVTQISDASTLLQQGVRYLDIRLSYYEGEWLTKHNYVSGEFYPVANQITTFLENNAGEFLILDFQHIAGIEYDNQEDYNMFKDMLEDYGLLEYAYAVNSLEDLTYGDLTDNRANSKIIIISKFTDSETEILKYDESIRSNWADSDDFDYVYNFLKNEAVDITSETTKFRVMQAVTTMNMSGEGILNALGSWSLINRAKDFNNYLIQLDDFESLLADLPIIMVDYADTNSDSFNDDIMEIIINFNIK